MYYNYFTGGGAEMCTTDKDSNLVTCQCSNDNGMLTAKYTSKRFNVNVQCSIDPQRKQGILVSCTEPTPTQLHFFIGGTYLRTGSEYKVCVSPDVLVRLQ